MTRFCSLLMVLAGVLLLGVASHAALDEPPRRVRLGTCGAGDTACAFCFNPPNPPPPDFDPAACPGAGATLCNQCGVDFFSQPMCDTQSSCTIDPTPCTIKQGTTFVGDLVITIDDAHCPDAPDSHCGKGAVTSVELDANGATGSPFSVAAVIDCCRGRQALTGKTGNLSCAIQSDGQDCKLDPKANPFLCDRQCSDEAARADPPRTAECCASETSLLFSGWLEHQLFPSLMSDAIRAAFPNTDLPVIMSATDESRPEENHPGDPLSTVFRFSVNVAFITPPRGFQSATFDPDCVISVCGNGQTEGAEDCDDGAANGTTASCCDTSCHFKPAGTPCDGAQCDAAGHCGTTTTTRTASTSTSTTTSASTTTSTSRPATTTTSLPGSTGTCATPASIPPQGGTFHGTTSGQSLETGSCGTSGASPEQVFAWTPGVSGQALIETCGPTDTTFDTVLHMRQGTCTAGAEIACNDDTAGCGTTTDPGNPHRGSRLSPTVTAGQTYFIVVDGYSGRQGSFVLRVVPPSPNARCEDPTVIPPEGGIFTGETSGGSTLAGSCGVTDSSPERVFAWTPAASGIAGIGTCGSGTTYDTVLYVRQNTCDGTEVKCNDDTSGCGVADGTTNANHHGSHLSLPVVADRTYFIVVDGYAGRQGNFTLTVNPPTSACQDPTVIPPGGGTFHGMTQGESTTAGTCGTSGSSPEQVFAWTPAGSGKAVIQTCSAAETNFDTVLYLRQDTCDAGTELACNDDTAGCGTTTDPSNPHRGSRLTPTVEAGRTYYIVVDGYAGRRGAFALEVQPPRSEGTCDVPTPVPPEGGTFPGRTSGESRLAGSCGASSKSPEDVFAWTPARSGVATFQTCSPTATSYDTVLYVRSETCAGGAELACNDDTSGCGTEIDRSDPHLGSRVNATVTAGRTYFIVVDGFGGRGGDFSLEVIPPR